MNLIRITSSLRQFLFVGKFRWGRCSRLPSSCIFFTAFCSTTSSTVCFSSIRVMSTTISSSTTSIDMKKRIAAIGQLRSSNNKYENLINIAYCARLAKEQNAVILFLPECFGFIGESSIETLEQAENPLYLQDEIINDDDTRKTNHESVSNTLRAVISDATIDDNKKPLINCDEDKNTHNPPTKVISLLDGLRTIAKESGLWISGGGIHIANAPNDPLSGNSRVYNTHVIIDNYGHLQTKYEKIHLFDVSILNKVELRESKTTAGGNKLVVCESPIGLLGLTTCYDIRFPEQYIALRNRGAQILLVPSAFTVPTGAAHWHALLKARAIESQCYVIAAAQYGRHNEKRESFGHSLAVDPWGKVVADAGGYPMDDDDNNKGSSEIESTPSIVTVEIDLDYLNSIRQRMPIDLHRSNASFE